jgi:hypothetical protein
MNIKDARPLMDARIAARPPWHRPQACCDCTACLDYAKAIVNATNKLLADLDDRRKAAEARRALAADESP